MDTLIEKSKLNLDNTLGECLYRLYSKPNQLISFLLTEAYKRSDDIDFVEVLKVYRSTLKGEYFTKDFYKFLDKKNISIEFTDGEKLIGGAFDLKTLKIIMVITKDVERDIFYANENDLKNIAANFWANFVHEDTHRQQFNAAGSYDIFKKYKKPKVLDWSDDIETDLDYYDQSIEADAYGREVASRLQTIFGAENSLTVLNKISVGSSVYDKYCERLISIYKDPRISEKSNKAFFRAIFDFLSENEL